jgi:hypothetical protein
MEKDKKGIDTFKNWLLARDSSSRISTEPSYHSFLESSENTSRTRSQVMDLFDAITSTSQYRKLNRFFDYGLFKDANSGNIQITIKNKDMMKPFGEFIECLNPSKWGIKNIIKIILDPDIKETIFNTDPQGSSPGIQILECRIPSSYTDSQIIEESLKVISRWIEISDFGEDYNTDFFKWWMNRILFENQKYDTFPEKFQSAIIEWMKQAPEDDVREAYLSILNNSIREDIKRNFTETGTKDIIDHINWGLKEFNINVEGVKKGFSVINRYKK